MLCSQIKFATRQQELHSEPRPTLPIAKHKIPNNILLTYTIDNAAVMEYYLNVIF